MHCELVIPDLFSAHGAGRHPALELLIARGRRTAEEKPQPLEHWLHEAFSLEGAALPAGALSLIATNRDPGGDSWLRADPVHLRLMRDHLVVVPAEALSISQAEADAFCASLNGHFAGTMDIHPLAPGRWSARFHQPQPGLEDVPALEHAGREIRPGRGRGPALTEIEMLLHTHPANAMREARGEPAINSLWLWGAGRAGKATSRWVSVLADEPLAMGLAMLARTRYLSLPADAGQWLPRAPEEGRHLIVLDALRVPAALHDSDQYRERLAALERDWFAPLLRALRAERVGMVTLHVPNAGQSVSFETIRADLRRFWRLAKPLGHYA